MGLRRLLPLLALLLALGLTPWLRLASVPPADAQGVGLFARPDCGTITSAVAGSTWCFESTTQVLKVWTGTLWATTTLSNSGTSGYGGLFSLANCATVVSPIVGQSYCFDRTTNQLKAWSGTSWFATTPIFDVRTYGADASGTIDSTTAIQATIDAATASAVNGGSIYIPSGLYKISAQLNVQNGRFIRLYGDGITSILRWTPATGNSGIIRFDGNAPAGTSMGVVERLQLDSSTVAPAGLAGLIFGPVNGLTYNFTIRGMTFNHLATGSLVNNQADEFLWDNNWFTGTVRGVLQKTPAGCASSCGASNHTFIANHFQNHSDWAVDFALGTRFSFIGNTVQSDAAGAAGVRVDATTAPMFLNNFFEWQTAPTGTAISINPTTVGGDSLGGGLIAGNTINLNNAATGVIVANIAGLHIGSNAFRLVTTAITVQSTASLVTILPQSAGTGVGTMLTDNRVDNGNLTNAESRMDALRVRGTLTGLAPLTLTTSAGPIIAMSGTTVAGQYMNLTNTGANLQFGIESSAGGAFVTGSTGYDTFLNTGNATGLAFGTNNAIRLRIPATGGVVVAAIPVFNASATLTNASFTFANLNLVLTANGMQVYCSDCTAAGALDQTCVGGGTGNLAVRVNGVFKCAY